VIYWDLLKFLTKNPSELLRLAEYVEKTYFHLKEYREKALKMSAVFYESYQVSQT
jgi:hypothetical protein